MSKALQHFSALIVEDDDADFELLKFVLVNHFKNITFKRVTNSASLIEKLGEEEYDILFLDLILPDADAWVLIPSIQEMQPQIETIVISGHDDVRIALDCVNMGTSYVVKGQFLETDLLKTLSQLLRVIIMRRELDIIRKELINPNYFYTFLLKVDEIGGRAVYYDQELASKFKEGNIENVLAKFSIYSITAIGQGVEYFKGISILPTSILEDFQVIVYSFSLKDPKAADPRLVEGYLQYCILVPSNLIPTLPNIKSIETLLNIEFSEFVEIQDLQHEDLDRLKRKVIEYLRSLVGKVLAFE